VVLQETAPESGGKRKVEISGSLDLQSFDDSEDPFNLVVYPYSLPGHLVRVVRRSSSFFCRRSKFNDGEAGEKGFYRNV